MSGPPVSIGCAVVLTPGAAGPPDSGVITTILQSAVTAGGLPLATVGSICQMVNSLSGVPYPLPIGPIGSSDVLIAGQAAVALENASLYEDLEMSYFSTVKALARAIEVKDPYTHGHSERVTEYAMAIARQLGLSERDKKNIKYAAALHDIGKIGIARRVLDKPGALTEEEFTHIKTHPQLGESIMEPVGFLKSPREIILHHHERYDGAGYPDGLEGEGIDTGSRILAVADAFEAMMSDRPYREALPLEEAVAELEKNSGSQFDPDVVIAFLEVLRQGNLSRSSRPSRLDV